MMSISELHKKLLAALALAVMGLAMAALSGCSSTEEAPPPEDTSAKDELCDEADAGTTECPGG